MKFPRIFILIFIVLFTTSCGGCLSTLRTHKQVLLKEEQLKGFIPYYEFLEKKEKKLIENKILLDASRTSYKHLIDELIKNNDSVFWDKTIEKLKLKDERNFFSQYYNPVILHNKPLKLNNKSNCNTIQLMYMNDIITTENFYPLLINMWLVTDFENKYTRLNLTHVILFYMLKKAGVNKF